MTLRSVISTSALMAALTACAVSAPPLSQGARSSPSAASEVAVVTQTASSVARCLHMPRLPKASSISFTVGAVSLLRSDHSYSANLRFRTTLRTATYYILSNRAFFYSGSKLVLAEASNESRPADLTAVTLRKGVPVSYKVFGDLAKCNSGSGGRITSVVISLIVQRTSPGGPVSRDKFRMVTFRKNL